jgi:VWFA-related protein
MKTSIRIWREAIPMKKVTALFLMILFGLLMTDHASTSSAQDDKQESELQHEVVVALKLVQVYVIDNKGNPVTDLEKSDFQLWDNGESIEITDFEKHVLTHRTEKTQDTKSHVFDSSPSRMNRKIFLFFDFAFTDGERILKSKTAALHFLDNLTNPSDEVGIISYSTKTGIVLHEYLTQDHDHLRHIVEQLGSRQLLGRAESVEARYLNEMEEMGKALMEASNLDKGSKSLASESGSFLVRMARNAKLADRRRYIHQTSSFIDEIKNLATAMRYIPGVKNIVLFSEGLVNFVLYGRRLAPDEQLLTRDEKFGNSTLRLMYEKMSKELASSNCPVFPVNVAGLASSHFKDRDFMGDRSLNQIAELSGGKYFDNVQTYEQIMEEIQNITGAYYILGYPIDEKWDGKYHDIKVKVQRKGCKVYGQKGYYNPKPFTEYTPTERMLHLIDLALGESPHRQELIEFPTIALPDPHSEKSNLLVFAMIPGQKIQELLGRKAELITLVFDEQDTVAAFTRDEILASSLTQNDVYYYATSFLKPGNYACRVVIRNLETGEGAVGSSSILIPESPDAQIKLYSPLLLVSNENTHYLPSQSAADVFFFDIKQYRPVLEIWDQKRSRLYAVIRCTGPGSGTSEVDLSASLIHLQSGERFPVSLYVQNRILQKNMLIFFIEFQIHRLSAGKYALHLFADAPSIESKSHTTVTFHVR